MIIVRGVERKLRNEVKNLQPKEKKMTLDGIYIKINEWMIPVQPINAGVSAENNRMSKEYNWLTIMPLEDGFWPVCSSDMIHWVICTEAVIDGMVVDTQEWLEMIGKNYLGNSEIGWVSERTPVC